MQKHSAKIFHPEKKSDTSGSFSNLTEKPITYEKEEAMLKAVLMDAKEFQVHSKLVFQLWILFCYF